MNELLAYVTGYGLPLGGLLLALVMMVLAVGVAMAWPRYIVMGYVAILMLFPMTSSYGFLDAADANLMYVKGTKTFFFSFLDMLIFGTWLMAVLYSRAYAKSRESLGPLMKYYLAFGAIFLGHVLVGLADPAHPSLLDFYGRGIINILWQGMLVALLLTVIRTEKDFKQLLVLMLVCIAAREVFGMVRYLFLGGDPQNAYANMQNLKVKITFWDINDSILASFLMAFCAWQLLVTKMQSARQRFGYLALAALSATTIVLSARRTAQGGLMLAVLALVWLLPRGRKWPVIIALALLVPAAVVVTTARGAASGTVMEKLFFDVRTDPTSDPKRNRFYELETAWTTVQDNLLFGVGPAGSFRVTSDFGLEYHKGSYDFVHSGFGHVLLKTGLIGLALFIGFFLCYFGHIRRHWLQLTASQQGIVTASVAAFGAQLPNMVVGTPIGEIRTMMVLGVIFVLPFLVVTVVRQTTKKTVFLKNELVGTIPKSTLKST